MSNGARVSNGSATRAWFSAVMLAVAGLCAAASGRTVVKWDFTQGPQGWRGNDYVEDLAASGEGLAFRSTGIDPWIEGPAVDLPDDGTLRIRVRMKSDADSHGELFYGPGFQAGRSVHFAVINDGRWHDYTLMIPEPQGAGTRFRLDPAADQGHVVVASIEVENLPTIQPPQWEKPIRPQRGDLKPAPVRSGDLAVEHYRQGGGGFVVNVDGREVAAGHQGELIGVALNGQPQWLDLGKAKFVYTIRGQALSYQATMRDRDGATWRMTRQFKPGPATGSVAVDVEFAVDRDRDVIHLPWLTLFPGLGTFAQRKTQALFAGLEYLDDEPSSSEADISTPEHVRRAPDPVKVTFPLMAIVHEGRYIGLVWEPSDAVQPVFDSPDTIYGSGAHLMALTGPAVGDKRFENALIAHTPLRLRANEPVRLRATIIGGKGDTVIPAVQKYVQLKGWPAVPAFKGGLDAAVELLAHGWLDSAINEGWLFRHAVWGDSFRAGPAADAPMYMDWLASHAKDRSLARRLADGRDQALAKLPAGQPFTSSVSHTRTPAAPLIFGGLYSYIERRRADAESLLTRFDERGIRPYQPGAVDYGRTHVANYANGHGAAELDHILEAATLSADPQLIEQALALLDKQTALYANTVPRGAQVWEMPLHTPDILASGRLVQAYTLGYILSGKPEHLEQARYWAWTGVPFIYLVNPTAGEVGTYATIAVLGATNWKAPVWFGQPVQWCGLVYGSALHLLSRYDREGPWETLAKGITAAGLQMTWSTSDRKRQGLLPDFFHLRAQLSDGPAINPGTVQAHIPELFDKGTLYDIRKPAGRSCFIHAPCAIRNLRQTQNSMTFALDGWGDRRYYVLLCGLDKQPAAVTVRPASGPERDLSAQARTDFDSRQRLLALPLDGPCEIELRF